MACFESRLRLNTSAISITHSACSAQSVFPVITLNSYSHNASVLPTPRWLQLILIIIFSLSLTFDGETTLSHCLGGSSVSSSPSRPLRLGVGINGVLAEAPLGAAAGGFQHLTRTHQHLSALAHLSLSSTQVSLIIFFQFLCF